MENKIETWGKDHWSLLAYIQTRCVDHKGVLDLKHLRSKNPMVQSPSIISPQGWKPDYGTRLKGYFLKGDGRDLTKRLDDHDDLDCIEDMEDEGLIENLGSGLHPVCKLTKKGKKISADLSSHKMDGGHFAGFIYKKI